MTSGPPRARALGVLAAVAAGYAVMARLSLEVVVADGLPILWAPAGLALAALLLGGPRLWPALIAGGLLTAAWRGGDLPSGLAFTSATTAQALGAALLISRVHFGLRLDRIRDVVVLAGLGGLVAPAVAATALIAMLAAMAPLAVEPAVGLWVSWWLSSFCGVVLITPVLLALCRVREWPRRRPTPADAGVAAALVGSAALLVSPFGSPYMIFPALLLTALRFHVGGAALASLVISGSAAWASSQGFGPAEWRSPEGDVLYCQSFMAIATLTSLMLGAVTSQRLYAQERLLDSEAERLVMAVEREAEQRFRRSFEDAPIGMALLGFHGHLLRVNHTLAEMTGRPEAQLVGSTLDDVTHPDDVGADARYVAELLAGSIRTYEVEKRLIRADGRVAWVLMGGSLVRDDAGRPAYLIAQLVDITERRAVEAELARSTDELRRSNQELERFAYLASHDLAEPLRTMSGFATLLRERYEDVLDERGLRYADHVIGAAGRMRELIDGLLEYSRSGRQKPACEPVALTPVVEEIIRELGARVSDRGATIDVRDLPVVLGDPLLLRQLLQNLIANALKFTDGRVPVVTVSAGWEEGDCRISVADNGIGIAAEHRDRIFEMFQRLHGRERFEGTGIGLALTKRIVELHGGRIWVDSAPGEGATFSFTLAPAPREAPEGSLALTA
jgi:PAS domain S-box-containing protein